MAGDSMPSAVTGHVCERVMPAPWWRSKVKCYQLHCSKGLWNCYEAGGQKNPSPKNKNTLSYGDEIKNPLWDVSVLTAVLNRLIPCLLFSASSSHQILPLMQICGTLMYEIKSNEMRWFKQIQVHSYTWISANIVFFGLHSLPPSSLSRDGIFGCRMRFWCHEPTGLVPLIPLQQSAAEQPTMGQWCGWGIRQTTTQLQISEEWPFKVSLMGKCTGVFEEV